MSYNLKDYFIKCKLNVLYNAKNTSYKSGHYHGLIHFMQHIKYVT